MQAERGYPPLSRVDSIDLDAIARGEALHAPGLVADWPALHRWNHDYLRARAGKASFVVETYPEGTPYGRVNCERMPLADYLAMLEATPSGRAPFLAETNRSLERSAPALESDIPVPQVLAAVKEVRAALFFGRTTTTHLHFHHSEEALLCQVVGKKRVVIFPPGETSRLHVYPFHSPRWVWSRVDIEAPDLERYPRFARARGVECTLAPGDAVLIPRHWWHAALSEGESGSVTWFWPSSRKLAHPAMSVRVSAAMCVAGVRRAWQRAARGFRAPGVV